MKDMFDAIVDNINAEKSLTVTDIYNKMTEDEKNEIRRIVKEENTGELNQNSKDDSDDNVETDELDDVQEREE